MPLALAEYYVLNGIDAVEDAQALCLLERAGQEGLAMPERIGLAWLVRQSAPAFARRERYESHAE